MSSITEVAELLPELLRQYNPNDNKHYVVQIVTWTDGKLRDFYARSSKFNIVPDELTNTLEGYTEFVLSGQAVFFEIVCLEDRSVVGLMYLSDLLRDYETHRFSSAIWHCEIWDAKAHLRKPILLAAIKELFNYFGLHRMGCEIPMKFGGAIRVARSLGFQIEGRKREAIRFGGNWFDVMVLSLLKRELQ